MKKHTMRLIRICLVIVYLYYLIKGEHSLANSIRSVFFSTFIPVILEKTLKIKVSKISQLIIITVVFLSSVLGKTYNFYNTHPNFDLILHFLAGLALADIGATIFKKKFKKKGMTILFSICFSLTFCCLWEIIEYLLDVLFNTNNQRWKNDFHLLCNGKIGKTIQPAGLIDTMEDLIAGLVGGIIYQLKYLYYKKK